MSSRHFIRQARLRAGITQAKLAARVATTQSAVARWESGGATPSYETLRDLVRACGFELRSSIVAPETTEWSLAQHNLALTPEQRLDQLVRTVDFIAAGRGAMAARPDA